MSLPGFLEPTSVFDFHSADGTKLYGEWFEGSEPAGIALMVHGYAEHCGRYREVAGVLRDLGHHVVGFDFRGHGRSEGQRGHIGRFAEYLDDVTAALAELRTRGGHKPLLLVGHSMGSLVTLRWLTDESRAPTDVYAAIVSSPFLGLAIQVPAPKLLLGRVASRLMPSLSLPNDLDPTALTTDPERQEARRVDTLCHDVASARWFTESTAAQEEVLNHAGRLKVPNLWLVAGNDRIALPSASRAVADRVRAPQRYEEFAGFEHEVFNEADRSRAFQTVREFVESHFPS